jgi:hypothetical protein
MAGKFLSSLFGLKKKPTCFATVSVLEFLKDKKVDSNSEGVVILDNVNFTDYNDFKNKLNDKKLKDVLKKDGAFIKLLNRLDKEYATQINEISVSSTSTVQKKSVKITIEYPPYKLTITITW